MTPQEARIERMRKAGIPIPNQTPVIENYSGAQPQTQNMDKHARLQALKSGANKQKIQQLVKAKSVQGDSGFQGIPEPKMRKNPNNPANKLSSPGMAVKPASFSASGSVNEFSAMEAMMAGDSHYEPSPVSAKAGHGDLAQPILSQDSGYGPTFNPAAMIAAKKAKMQAQQVNSASENQPQGALVNQNQFDINQMKSMMEEIAKSTISEVLNDYTNKGKGRFTYENVGKSKDGSQIIKTGDGLYYKLTEVKLKKN